MISDVRDDDVFGDLLNYRADQKLKRKFTNVRTEYPMIRHSLDMRILVTLNMTFCINSKFLQMLCSECLLVRSVTLSYYLIQF